MSESRESADASNQDGKGPVGARRATSRPRPEGEMEGHTVQPWEQPPKAGPARVSAGGPPTSGDEATPKSPGAKDVPHPDEGADEARTQARTARGAPSGKPQSGYHEALEVAPGRGADQGGFPQPEPQQGFAAKVPEGGAAGHGGHGGGFAGGQAQEIAQALAGNLAKAVRPAVVEALGDSPKVDEVCARLADHFAQWLHQSVVQAVQGRQGPAPRPPGVRPGAGAMRPPRPDGRQQRRDRAAAEAVGGGDPQGPPPPRARLDGAAAGRGRGGAEAA